MSNTPSDAEILALAQQHLKAFAQFSPGEVWLEGEVEFARAVLAKWGTPQPVARESLSDAQIAEMMRDTWGCASIAPRHAMGFARAVEAEVRKQDTNMEGMRAALIVGAAPQQGAQEPAFWMNEKGHTWSHSDWKQFPKHRAKYPIPLYPHFPAPQPAPACHHRPPCAECASLTAQGGK